MERMEQEEYLSPEEVNQSQLLNDEWDYSNSRSVQEEEDEYPEDDDRIIES